MSERRIEDCEIEVCKLNRGLGNPRKITPKNRDSLQQSLETFGNFGVIVIDEDDNIIAGNQRASILEELDPHQKVSCKRLVGYTEAELRAINIKDNTHSGDWDLDILADWTADLTVDLGLDFSTKEPDERKIKEMELIHYEKYDYVMLVCRNEIDYARLVGKLGIAGAKVSVTSKRKINARAVWFDDVEEMLFSD